MTEPARTSTLDPAREAAIEAAYRAAKAIDDKHGYFYSVLSDEEKVQYELALEQEGFTQEIALIKTKLWSAQVLFPEDFALTERLVHLLERLYKAQANLAKKDEGLKPDKALDKIFGNAGFKGGPMGARFAESPGTA